jgi:ABC-type Mn2+/Zn2+ transport system permease subunit
VSEIFSLEFMRLAAVAGVASALALSVLGVYVVLKRVVFVGLTLANVATLGAALALALRLPLEFTAIAASLVAAVALAAAATPRRVPAESVIGWGFAAASALTVLILARTAADADAMRLLFGNVLAISGFEAVLAAGVAAVVLAVHVTFAKRFVLVVFDPQTARAAGISTGVWTVLLYVTIGGATAAAVHETGALLAFALLVLPATAALLATRGLRAAFFAAPAIAVAAVLGGLVLSFRWDLPTGPLTVALLAAAVPLAAMFGGLRDRFGRTG